MDTTFGLYSDGKEFKIGDTSVIIDDNDIIIGDKRYNGTAGLWELLTINKPNETIYDMNDYNNYAEILLNTNAMRRNNDPNELKPKSSRSYKWNNIVKPIWNKYVKAKQSSVALLQHLSKQSSSGQGLETIILPNDPNALVNRLD